MSDRKIIRRGSSPRWSDVVINDHVAYWVEVAEDNSQDARGQVKQCLEQINATLEQIGSDRTQLLQIVIHLADLADAKVMNEIWDAWVPKGCAPVRACVQSGLSAGYHVEMIITAAVE